MNTSQAHCHDIQVPGVCRHKIFRQDLHFSLSIAGVLNRASTGTFLLFWKQLRLSLSLNFAQSAWIRASWMAALLVPQVNVLSLSGYHGTSQSYHAYFRNLSWIYEAIINKPEGVSLVKMVYLLPIERSRSKLYSSLFLRVLLCCQFLILNLSFQVYIVPIIRLA